LTASLENLPANRFDVVICGGGLAGLTLARQLRRNLPQLSILVADRLTRPIPESAFKVGESSVEMGSQYLERLGLRDYLVEKHLFKYGLRFFPGGGQLPLDQRPELGPSHEPIVPSYQLDRGTLEHDLRGMICEDGVVLLEGAKVGEVELGADDDDHRIEITQGDDSRHVGARWVIDATGRASLLRKRKKLTRGNKYSANASWFRLEGKLDITEMVPESNREWHDAKWAKDRWRSTNHLMGPGYWAWVIPLGTGNTSIGLVGHDSHVPFDEIHTLEKTLGFLEREEPHLAKAIEAHKILDFGCYKNYSYNVARSWSSERWALIGEAGAFADPLYSPGTDFIAIGNMFTEEVIRLDLEGGDLVDRARELSTVYRSLINGAVDLYREAAPVYGHAPAMLAKTYWDNFLYWSYPCQFIQQELYKRTGAELMEVMPMGERFAALARRMQTLFAAWAELAPAEPVPGFHGMPGFPSVLIDAHLALQNKMTHEETFEYIGMRLVQGEEIAGELLLRAMDEVGPSKAAELLERVRFAEWNLEIFDERVAATETVGLGRRHALRPLAKDVERTLGRTPHRIDEAGVRAALGELIVSGARAADTTMTSMSATFATLDALAKAQGKPPLGAPAEAAETAGSRS
jgi:flavin-dependent dehydrogenase